MLYAQQIKTSSVLLLLTLSTVLGFTLYKDTVNGRTATYQLYSFAIDVWYALMPPGAKALILYDFSSIGQPGSFNSVIYIYIFIFIKGIFIIFVVA